MSELISEAVTPLLNGHSRSNAGNVRGLDAAAMARGEPGLPGGFVWRGCEYRIVERLAVWKESSREGSSAGGDLYLRRHCYRLKMSDGTEWNVYFVRQSPKSGNARVRWFLYTIDTGKSSPSPLSED